MVKADDFPLKRPGEKMIAFDPDSGHVFYSDFPPSSADRQDASGIIDLANNGDVAEVIGAALGRIGQIVESQCRFRGQAAHIRVIAEESSPESGPTSEGTLKEVAWTRRVLVFIRHD